MRERRRLELTHKQLLLAGIARREALGTMAEALRDEGQSAALAERTRMIADDYADKTAIPDGSSLTMISRFTGALQAIATDAERAGDAARERAKMQSGVVSASQERLRKLQDRASQDHSKLLAAQELRADPHSQMARKLRGGSSSCGGALTSQNPRTPK